MSVTLAVMLGLVACGSDVFPPPALDELPGTNADSGPDGSSGTAGDGSTLVDGGLVDDGGTTIPVDAGPGPRPKTDAGGGDAGPCTPSTPTVACLGKCGDVDDGCGGTHQCGNTCSGGQLCDLKTNLCINPRATCEDFGAECGLVVNDCGNTVNCGNCPDDIFGNKRECDQGTYKCVACPANIGPSLCTQIGFQCGTLDRCGQTVNCGTCGAGQSCDAVTHTCEPNTNQTCNGRCGPISDGHGGIIDCGGCPTGQACGVGGVANQCAPSKPAECAAFGVECGPLASQCGGTIQCGGCGNGQVCRSNGTCGAPCQPKTCGEVGAQCGYANDGCGKLVNCGPCGNGGVCNPNNNQCCQPLTCSAYPGGCGTFSNGCGGNITCNPCGAGQTCLAGGGCCTKKTCANFPGQCGNISDGCGGVITCGCNGGLSCVGGSCQTCTPKTCAANFKDQCGTFSDGCGSSITCTCTGNETCGGGGQPGYCGCVNTTVCPPNYVGPFETCTGTLYCSQ